MRTFRLIALAALCTAATACFDSASQTCKSGLVCPEGAVCAAVEDVCLRTYPGTSAACGDGLLNGPNEVCDDGNLRNGDGCSSDCQSTEVCGNSRVDTAKGEVCDDGNSVSGDKCSADCRSSEVCGNAIVDLANGEVCDDGNLTNADGCTRDCLSTEFCGNAYIDTAKSEVCDDNNTVSGDGCSSDCKSLETCGNGKHDPAAGEVCDDGENVDGDGCSADCKSLEVCGNNIRDTAVGEVCDDGNQQDGDSCSADCRSGEGCGNGTVDTVRGEECDDGNVNNGDDCSSTCKTNFCGDGDVDTVLPRVEACDHGNGVGGESADCNSNCTVRECGDGLVNTSAGETCDTSSGSVCDNDPATSTPDCDTATCDGRAASTGNICTQASCGDGYANTVRGEECDTGGETVTCDSNCTAARCGDGWLNQTNNEECDKGDADTLTCDGSGAGVEKCTPAFCGDGYANSARSEACDTAVESASCDGDCTPVECGDGRVNTAASEACDNLGGSDTSACDGSSAGAQRCTAAQCGDGYVNGSANETCDEGVSVDTATCNGAAAGTNKCRAVQCGDGHVNAAAGEGCDNLGGSDTASCDGTAAPVGQLCTPASCGDAYVNAAAGETCDVAGGGDTAACDGANAAGQKCTAASCGDLYVNAQAGEQCEDGDSENNDDCVGTCQNNICGDGFVDENPPLIEACDDGNTDPGQICPYGPTADCTVCDSLCASASTMPARYCGNGTTETEADALEACDDRNALSCGTCNDTCGTPQPAAAATGRLTMNGDPGDGKIFTIDDGVLATGTAARTFEFDRGTNFNANHVRIQYSQNDSSSVLATKVAAAIEGERTAGRLMVGAVVNATNTSFVDLTHTAKSVLGNKAIVENASNFNATGLTGGAAGDCGSGVSCNSNDDCSPLLTCNGTSKTCSAPLTAPTVTGTTPPSPADNNNLTVDGTAPASSTVNVYTDALCQLTVAGTAVASSGGSFSVPVTVADNTVTTFYATATDASGNVSNCSTSSATYIEDSADPAAPSITSTSPGSPSNDETPDVIGSAEAGATVRIFSGSCAGTLLGTGTATGGTFTINVTVPVDAATELFADATDAAANVSACSAGFVYTEDSTIAAPVVTGFTPSSPANNNAPFVNGTAEEGSTVQLYTGTTCGNLVSGATAVTSGGTFSIQASVNNDSQTDFSVRAVDVAGNVSACSNSMRYTEDSTAPNLPQPKTTTPPSGSNENAITVNGDAPEAGVTIRLFANDALCGEPSFVTSGLSDANAKFSIAVTVADNSATTFYARAVDAAGNASGCSVESVTYVEDSTAANEPTVTGTSPTSPSTSESVSVLGTADPGATVTIYSDAQCSAPVGGMGTGTAALVTGSFSVSVTVPLNSTTTFYATATDAANNTSPCSTTFATYVRDNQMATPVITAAPSSPSQDRTPTFIGTAEPGSTVRLFSSDNCGNGVGTTTADASGNWTITSSQLGANATYSFTVNGTDALNNNSACSTPGVPYVTDNTAPGAPTITGTNPASPGNVANPQVLGTSEPGAFVSIHSGSCTGTEVGSATADGAGAFTVQTVGLADGATTTLFAKQRDVAGNQGTTCDSISYTHDNTIPGAPTVTGTTPSSPSNDNNPVVNGTAEASATVTVHTVTCDGVQVGTGTADGAGAFAVAVTTALPSDASTALFVKQRDVAGNQGIACASLVYTEDSTAPGAPTISGTTPASPSNDETPVVNGVGEPGATVTILTDSCTGTQVGSGTADGAGAYAITTSALPQNATTSLFARQTDVAGNAGVDCSSISYTEDSTAPAAPTISGFDPPSPGSSNDPFILGSAEPNADVYIHTNSTCSGTELVGGKADATGAFRIQLPTVADNSTTDYWAEQSDAATNGSACSGQATYVEFTEVTAGAVLQLDSAVAASYDGTSQTWANVVSAPADGSVATAYDVTRGTDTTAQTMDPTFNGTAGGGTSSEFFSFDGGDLFALGTNTAFLESMHKDGAKWTLEVWLTTPATFPTTSEVIGTHTPSTSTRGFWFGFDSATPYLFMRADGGSGTSFRSDTSVAASTTYMFAVSYDEASGTGFLYRNGSIVPVGGAQTFNATFSSPDGGAAGTALRIGGHESTGFHLGSGTRVHRVRMYNQALSEADLDGNWHAGRDRFGLAASGEPEPMTLTAR